MKRSLAAIPIFLLGAALGVSSVRTTIATAIFGGAALAAEHKPAARHGHALAFDATLGMVILHGGAQGGQVLGDTWAWNGQKWKRLDRKGPVLKPGLAMASDPADLVGKTRAVGVGAASGAFETWEFDGDKWVQIPRPGGLVGPASRGSYALAFVSRLGIFVLFGGGDPALPPGPALDTWHWNRADKVWALQPAAVGPQERTGHSMASHGRRGNLVLFGGRDSEGMIEETWTYDGVSWELETSLSAPFGRIGTAMSDLSALGVVVLFGGFRDAPNIIFDDTWAWDGSVWFQRLAERSPSARHGHAMAYDARRNTVVLFGGRDASGNDLGDTWEFTGSNWVLIAP